jgi:hypothetical protein
MPLAVEQPTTPQAPHATITLRLIWQDPATSRFIDVGRLSELPDGRYSFEYLPTAAQSGMPPLAEFPLFDTPYVGTQLPAFFQNRVMSTKRQSYPTYLGWLGLHDVANATPLEILARDGGERQTDTFHVVDSFAQVGGHRTGRFFASGVRHIDGASSTIDALRPGDLLALRPDPDNPVNREAQLLCARTDRPVGWVPDWLLPDIKAWQDARERVNITVAQVNPDAPFHLRLMCLLESTARAAS